MPRVRSNSIDCEPVYEEDESTVACPELTLVELTRIQEDVASLAATDVRLLAVDADLTLFRVHTGGQWRGTPEGLSKHIRPLFLALIPEAIAAGLHIAIVTFSPQARLIHEAVSIAMPDLDFSNLIVRGGQRQIICENGDLADAASCEGARKQKHIASVLDCLYNRGTPVRPDEIVLVDDDLFNIEEARDNGMRGALFSLEQTSKLPRARRRGSVMEMESAPKIEVTAESPMTPQRPPMMRRTKSLPLEEDPLT